MTTLTPTAALATDRADDELDLEQVIDDHESAVFALALRVTGCRAAAEEITQDVFLRVWTHPDSFNQSRGNVRSWLSCMCHSRSVDWVRREEAIRRRHMREANLRPMGVATTEEQVGASELADNVRAALAALPERQHQAIRLAYFDGFTYRDVAREMRIPEGTAKSHIRLGMERLGRELKRVGYVDLSEGRFGPASR